MSELDRTLREQAACREWLEEHPGDPGARGAKLGAADWVKEEILTLPKPYYEHAGITIYHGDCREILPQLPKVDLVLADPPYGITYKPRASSASGTGRKSLRAIYGREVVKGDDQKFDPRPLLLVAVDQIFWGANYYADLLPTVASWLIWDKRCDPRFYGSNSFADCELAWCSNGKPARIHRQIWSGVVRQGNDASLPRLHPTQKPFELMVWCISLFPNAKTVLDPYMGSGTTLVSAKQLGRRAIGIEIEEKYCEIAVKRLSQEMLFDVVQPPAPAQTESLFSEADL